MPWTGESYERWLQTHGFHLRRPSPGSSSFHVLHHIQRVVLGSEELDMQRSFSPVSGFPGHDYKNRGEIGRRKDVPTMRMIKIEDARPPACLDSSRRRSTFSRAGSCCGTVVGWSTPFAVTSQGRRRAGANATTVAGCPTLSCPNGSAIAFVLCRSANVAGG